MTTNSQPIQALAGALAVFLTFSALVGILVLYLIKCTLGVDLIPGFSWGRQQLKRRQAVEPVIGHPKADQRMARCWLNLI